LLETGVHVAPSTQQAPLLLEIGCVLLDEKKAVPEIGISRLVRGRGEVLRHERCVNADEMSPIQRSSDRQIEFGAAAELRIEPAKPTQRFRPSPECTAP
jgi:hypothetical protein